jgi:membrane protein YqaA with SNARE-associated domain
VVGPISEAEREAGNRKIKLVLLAIVTASPPLIALQLDPSPIQLLAAAGVGLCLGLVVVWYLGRLAAEFAGSGRRPGRRR